MTRFAGVLSLFSVLVCGCATTASSQLTVAPAKPVEPVAVVAEAPVAVAEVVAASAPANEVAAVPAVAQEPEEIPDGLTAGEEEDSEEPVAEEGEAHEGEVDDNGLRYSTDLSDEALKAQWAKTPETLGSISIGFVDEGRIVNGQQFPAGDGWVVVQPEKAWATQETVEQMIAAIREVRAQYPNAPPLRVNQISAREGGYLRPHKSHQNGRDVDLGFYYPTAEPIRVREREKYIDVEKNWALLKALVIRADVQMILVDRRVQKVIYDHALAAGEDKAWLDSLFHAGIHSIVRHARRHRDHFHVRFFNARAQELGRRVAPLLAMRPDQNIRMHRVRKGDTLGGIAARYGSSVNGLKKVNRLRTSFLRISQVLQVPLRGPCTRCPVPPAVVVPPRRLPPGFEQTPVVASVSASPAPLAPPPEGTTSASEVTESAPAAASANLPLASPSVVSASATGAAVVVPATEAVKADVSQAHTRESVAAETSEAQPE